MVNGRDGDQRECYLEIGTSWFQHQDEWAAMPAVDGPDTWQRIDVAIDESRQEPQGQGTEGCGDPQSSTSRRVNIVQPVQDIEVVELPEVEVSNVEMGEQSVEFDVSEPGVPVLVRVSYFPNWTAHGAEGPYRIGPNQMVVIPTDTHVRLEFERSTTDLFFYGLTILGHRPGAVRPLPRLALPEARPDWDDGAPPPLPAAGLRWPATSDFGAPTGHPGRLPPATGGEPPPPPPPPAALPLAPALPPPPPDDDDRSGSSIA